MPPRKKVQQRADVGGNYLDWVWAPSSGGASTTALDDFWQLPPLVKGELLARILRLLNGESRPGDVEELEWPFLAVLVVVGRAWHRVVFFVCDRSCVALVCCTTTGRDLNANLVDLARRRAKPCLPRIETG